MGNSTIMIGIWIFFGIAGVVSIVVLIGSTLSILQGYESFLAKVRAWQIGRKTLIIGQTDAADGSAPLYKNYWSHQTSLRLPPTRAGLNAPSAKSTPRDTEATERRKRRTAG